MYIFLFSKQYSVYINPFPTQIELLFSVTTRVTRGSLRMQNKFFPCYILVTKLESLNM